VIHEKSRKRKRKCDFTEDGLPRPHWRKDLEMLREGTPFHVWVRMKNLYSM
jgi:hypothetical protein